MKPITQIKILSFVMGATFSDFLNNVVQRADFSFVDVFTITIPICWIVYWIMDNIK